MRVTKTLVILFVVLMTLCCVNDKGQQAENIPPKSPPKVTSIADNEAVTQPAPQTKLDKEWLSYEPAVVELRGKLITKWYYGPPNYGEDPITDSRELLPILVLDHPVNVRGNPDPEAGPNKVSVENVRDMELVLTIPHKNMIGKKVIVKGTLFHGFTGHHHTDVLMSVQEISLAASNHASGQKLR